MTRNTNLKRTLISALAALTFGGAVMSAAAPAQALSRRGAFAVGLVGGLALGATAAHSYPAYAVHHPRCYLVREPVTNHWGVIVYYRTVRYCG